MHEFTANEYRLEIKALAKDALKEAREHRRDLDEVIHEAVDGHQWIIYHRFNLGVLQHSDNETAVEEIGGLEEVLRELFRASGLLAYIACAAMMADVHQAAVNHDEDEDEDEDEDGSAD